MCVDSRTDTKENSKILAKTQEEKICQVSCVTCQQQQQPQPQTLPMLIPELCTVDWFTKTEIFVLGNQPIYLETENNFKT